MTAKCVDAPSRPASRTVYLHLSLLCHATVCKILYCISN